MQEGFTFGVRLCGDANARPVEARRFAEKWLPAWTGNQSAIPLQDGFLNKWRLDAPVGDQVITCRGVCTVQMISGLIYRNEVYFDMFP
jgi:hypothetical protein